jgi:drug/metabolite transporter (DMT)-like permease
VALCVGGLAGLVRVREWRVPPWTFALGLAGIFGYHALFFLALRHAPTVEVNLLQYLWPLLIVILSPLYLRSSLRPHHLLGACLGLAGAALVISGGRLRLDLGHLPGYLLALAAGFVWASYSLLTKRVRPFATGAVGGFCLASGLLALALHALERLSAPALPPLAVTPREWLDLLLLGLGPMGLAFYSWDAAMKRGDPRVIGALAYLTPLLSTLVLVLFGGRHLTALSGCAMGLIVAGAGAGSLDLLSKHPGDAGGQGVGHGAGQHGLDPQPGQVAAALGHQGADAAHLDGDAGKIGEPAEGEGRDQPGLRA